MINVRQDNIHLGRYKLHAWKHFLKLGQFLSSGLDQVY